jgi:hypothetical protein
MIGQVCVDVSSVLMERFPALRRATRSDRSTGRKLRAWRSRGFGFGAGAISEAGAGGYRDWVAGRSRPDGSGCRGHQGCCDPEILIAQRMLAGEYMSDAGLDRHSAPVIKPQQEPLRVRGGSQARSDEQEFGAGTATTREAAEAVAGPAFHYSSERGQ